MTERGEYTKADLGHFFDAYLGSALNNPALEDDWGERPEPSWMGRRTEDEMVADCKKFLDAAWPLLRKSLYLDRRSWMEHVGTLFWSSRNQHKLKFSSSGGSFMYFGRPFIPLSDRRKLDAIARRFGAYHLTINPVGPDFIMHREKGR